MKIAKYTYLILALSLGAFSCKKAFLDRQPSTAVLETNAIKTANDMNDAVNGMYAAMTPATWYGRDVPLMGDLLADNVYVSFLNSGRFLPENNFTYSSTNGEAYEMYLQAYFVILQANRILTAQVPASDDVSQLRGEAYITRALNYLMLVNFYAHPATVAPNDPGVALVLAPTNGNNPNIKPARATVSAVYKQIISDLDSAYLIMPAGGTSLHPANSEYLSKDAAKAIESRAYLYEGDYANAKAAALLVVNNGGYTLSPASGLLAYWADPAPQLNKLETIFELSQTTITNDSFDALASMYSQSGSGYGDELVTTDLYNKYAKTDIRKSLIITDDRGGPVLVNNKYSNLENTADKDDIKVIRYAEVLLTLAESYARTDDETDALIYLNMLAKTRDPSLVPYTSTGTQLISDIITERRKELAFEGLRYFDLTRQNIDIVRPQQDDSAPSIALVPKGDDKRILPIPQAEIDANPNMVQNPGYRAN
jgi:starch-binding outer membrane protein, SusD/RagB family